VRLIVEILR